ncbi:MAG TPA: HyaD/HybD family hydrogenase maturation endopeptidase [Gemmatimonadales bacterium]|nr:HyaD/HybD family hydrogenase maturation endopeptidase [Gemmatimonadales bacterium]
MAPTPDPTPRTVVLGLGNPLMEDDGFGLAVVDRLRNSYEVGPEVELIDGGTWGMNLLPAIETASELILVDAIRSGAAPGTVVELERAQLPRYLAHKLSPHQIDLKEVLALAEWRGTLPERTVAIGAEPAAIEMSVGLTPALADAVPLALAAVRARLADWGRSCDPRRAMADA